MGLEYGVCGRAQEFPRALFRMTVPKAPLFIQIPWPAFGGFRIKLAHAHSKTAPSLYFPNPASCPKLPRMTFPQPTPAQARVIWLGITALALAMFLAFIASLTFGLAWVAQKLSSIL